MARRPELSKAAATALVALAAGFATGLGGAVDAAAQQPAASQVDGQVDNGSFEEVLEGEAGEDALDELDLLSRTTDDPFPEIDAEATRRPVSVTVRALNKVTAKFTDLVIPMNEVAAFGSLDIAPYYCDKRPPEEFPEATAFLQVFDRGFSESQEDAKLPYGPSAVENTVQRADETALGSRPEPAGATLRDADGAVAGRGGVRPVSTLSASLPAGNTPPADEEVSEGAKVFSGWMFASSPGLNPLEHAVYDVWVIDCQTETVEESASSEEE